MHKGLALLFSIFLLTCSGSDITACDGKDGICLALAVEGTVSGLDQLAVTLDQPAAKTLKTPTPPQAFSLPVQLALLLSAQPSGTLKVSVDGMTAGQVVAHRRQAAVLEQVAACAGVDGRQHMGLVAEDGQHQDLAGRVAFGGAADHLPPAAIGQPQVGEQDVHRVPLQPVQRLGHRAAGLGQVEVRLLGQHRRQPVTGGDIVFDQEHLTAH